MEMTVFPALLFFLLSRHALILIKVFYFMDALFSLKKGDQMAINISASIIKDTSERNQSKCVTMEVPQVNLWLLLQNFYFGTLLTGYASK